MLQEVPEDFILEGFQAKPKGPKAPKKGADGGGDENGDGDGQGQQGQAPPPQEKKKQQLCLLGAQAALQYGIVFSTLRYDTAWYGAERYGTAWYIRYVRHV